VFERALTKVHDSIREGETFAEPLRESKVVRRHRDEHDRRGRGDGRAGRDADEDRGQLRRRGRRGGQGALVSLLQPLMVIVLGGMVGTIIIAMFLPLVEMIESVSGGGM
jgi:type IV pilus assembly protein PilC